MPLADDADGKDEDPSITLVSCSGCAENGLTTGRRASSATTRSTSSIALGNLEDRLIREALERSGGNKNQAAQAPGIKRTTLVEKLRRVSRR